MHWHSLTPEASLAEIKSTSKGLSQQEVKLRQAKYGPNTLVEGGIKSPWKILWEQLRSIMVVILLVAAGLSAVLGDYQDAVVILAIVVFFVSLGVYQEYRAEQAIASLKDLAVPDVRVKRDGKSSKVPAPELVPGDLLLLEAGDQIPADARIIESHSLKAQEAALTGESEALEKQTQAIEDQETPLAERTNMLYRGTHITYGRGQAVVVATGMETELGHIAEMIQGVEDRQTPLQKRLDHVGKVLAVVAIAFSALIFLIGILRQEEFKLMLMSAISVAVAAVPEGLPAVLTVTLAFGSQRMLKRNALVRKLTGIETLGSVAVICSDKTGTLTQNKMTVTHLVNLQESHQIAQANASGESEATEKKASEDLSADLQLILLCASLCNDSELQTGKDSLGDPTELALLAAAQQLNWDLDALQTAFPRQDELPFDSDRKRMTTVHQIKQIPDFLQGLSKAFPEIETAKFISFTKGSIDALLDAGSQSLDAGQWQDLNEDRQNQWNDENQILAGEGQRVLAFAMRFWDDSPRISPDLETDLKLLGLMAMIDPPRPEARDAVKVCKKAGIRPIMITGDHPLTALKIAQELGITETETVLTGREIQNLDQGELQTKLADCQVFARVSPEHKLRIVEALQAQNKVVAMTGDGVNDAPALKQADIGVAMGITGTDVSKEAADMILQDDNFATIVAAIEEGRIIYDNLRKFIKFSVAGNLGKIGVMLLAPLVGMPLALLPIQMLWLNLMTDGLLGFGLGLEKAENQIMERDPTPPDESIFGGAMLVQILWMGSLIAGISMGLGAWSWFEAGKEAPWQTILFTSLAFAQIFQALGIRSSQDHLWQIGIFSNRVLWGMIVIVLGLQLAVIYLPFLQGFFHTQPLSGMTLLTIFAANALIWVVSEIIKASGKSV